MGHRFDFIFIKLRWLRKKQKKNYEKRQTKKVVKERTKSTYHNNMCSVLLVFVVYASSVTVPLSSPHSKWLERFFSI